ncbi:sulfotransferase [Halothece sp. PCC 7418]|uniref:sulfotransferase domain-containing protein n=1 Tax=Halothece sp. (strain PCC 7418) TaxID=65093 RepID=UPI0002A0837B|nr:sulfotransferase domain-containing protein [Halothece sp. PCC 7418]AFZ44053.1 sulfotransferase [Halothece sp. PCC 7418]
MNSLVSNMMRDQQFNYNRRSFRICQSLGLGIVQQSPYDNIYYCCTQKTASQTIKAVLKDFIFYKNTGLLVYAYSKLGLREASHDALFQEGLPKKTIGTHLYINYSTYQAIPKPNHYKTFFVMRDPRDLVVSFYFSAKYSHGMNPTIKELRSDLEKLDLKEGLKYMINRGDEFGLFEAQRSWVNHSVDQNNVKIFLYEDLANNLPAFFQELFAYLGIVMEKNEFNVLCDKYQFEKKSMGRVKGMENKNSHYRKGLPGDWKNYFDEEIMKHFQEVTTDLVEVLGYSVE